MADDEDYNNYDNEDVDYGDTNESVDVAAIAYAFGSFTNEPSFLSYTTTTTSNNNHQKKTTFRRKQQQQQQEDNFAANNRPYGIDDYDQDYNGDGANGGGGGGGEDDDYNLGLSSTSFVAPRRASGMVLNDDDDDDDDGADDKTFLLQREEGHGGVAVGDEQQQQQKSHDGKRYKGRFGSFLVLCVLNVVFLFEGSLIVPTIYPLLVLMGDRGIIGKDIDQFATVMIGVIMCAYSASAFLFTPLMSKLALKLRYNVSFAIGLVLCALGNLVYALSPNAWVALVGRLLAGVGAGSLGATFMYTTAVTSPKERTQGMINLRMAGSFGLLFGPALSTGITGLWELISKALAKSHPRLVKTSTLKVDYIPFGPFFLTDGTLAGWFSVLICLLMALLVLVTVKQPPALTASEASEAKKKKKVTFRAVMLIPLLVNFMINFLVTCFQSIVTPETNAQYKWTGFQNSLFFVGTSLISVVAMFATKLMACCINDRILVIFGLILTTAGILASFAYTALIPFWQFVLGAVLLMFGYTLVVSVTPAVYSKLIHPSELGVAMAYIPMVGALARTYGPLASFLYGLTNSGSSGTSGSSRGYVITLGLMAAFCVLCLVFMIVFYCKLGPIDYYSANRYSVPRDIKPITPRQSKRNSTARSAAGDNVDIGVESNSVVM